MAFFSKLKDRLFKSSSKLEEGLDAIVEDGGEAEPDRPSCNSLTYGLTPTTRPLSHFIRQDFINIATI